MRDNKNPFVKGSKNNVITIWEVRKEKKNLRSLYERITQESCSGYVEGDEYKALSGGKYGGYVEPKIFLMNVLMITNLIE